MVNNKILVGIMVVLFTMGAVVAITLSVQEDVAEDDNLSNGFGFFDSMKGSNQENKNTLNVNNVKNTVNIVNIAVVNNINQYFDIIIVNNNKNNNKYNKIDFNEFAEGSVNVGGHTFDIPQGTYVSNGYDSSDGDLICSEIYKTSDKTSFGIIVISNPDYNAEQLVNELNKDSNSNVVKFNTVKIGSSDNINLYKFQSKGLIYYVYDDGSDIVLIVMDTNNDSLFMFLTNSSSTGEIDLSNPYYQDYETINSDEELQNDSQNEGNYQEDNYSNDNYYYSDDESYDDSNYN